MNIPDPITQTKRYKFNRNELMDMVRDEMVDRFIKLQNRVEHQHIKQKKCYEELAQLRESNLKMKNQLQESVQREGILVMRLTIKEQEVQELVTQIQEMKQAQNPGSAQLQMMFLDPAINIMLQQIKQELDANKTKLEVANEDLSGIKFTSESQIGKRLIAKCRLLLQENEEIGRMISSGSISKLEGEISLQKQFIQQTKKSEQDNENYLEEMDEEIEGLQSIIYDLQNQLTKTKAQLHKALQENAKLDGTRSKKSKNYSNDKLSKYEENYKDKDKHSVKNNNYYSERDKTSFRGIYNEKDKLHNVKMSNRYHEESIYSRRFNSRGKDRSESRHKEPYKNENSESLYKDSTYNSINKKVSGGKCNSRSPLRDQKQRKIDRNTRSRSLSNKYKNIAAENWLNSETIKSNNVHNSNNSHRRDSRSISEERLRYQDKADYYSRETKLEDYKKDKTWNDPQHKKRNYSNREDDEYSLDKKRIKKNEDSYEKDNYDIRDHRTKAISKNIVDGSNINYKTKIGSK